MQQTVDTFESGMRTRQHETLVDELQAYHESARENGLGFDTLRHPLVYSVPHFPAMAWFCNEQLKQKHALLQEALETGQLHRYVFVHERPWRLQALVDWIAQVGFAEDEASAREYWRAVASIWTDSENIHQNLSAWRKVWQGTPAQASWRHAAMKEGEARAFAALPEEVRIYRGQCQVHAPGMSWTLNLDKAQWFARRSHQRKGRVLVGTVPRDKVLACFLGRGEDEIVVYPEDVRMEAN